MRSLLHVVSFNLNLNCCVKEGLLFLLHSCKIWNSTTHKNWREYCFVDNRTVRQLHSLSDSLRNHKKCEAFGCPICLTQQQATSHICYQTPPKRNILALKIVQGVESWRILSTKKQKCKIHLRLRVTLPLQRNKCHTPAACLPKTNSFSS